MQEHYKKVLSQLDEQLGKVFNMMEFDKDFISMVINQLRAQGTLLEAQHGIRNDKLLPYGAINLLESICESGPKRRKYQPIYNQSLVLLVSYFASAVSAIFNETLTYFLNHVDEIPKDLAKEEFKFSVRELKELEYDLSIEIGRVVARKSDISFQDMQSIYRAFKRYFEIDIGRSDDVDTIIAAQSLRHAIVHNSEMIDEKCQRQLILAKDRKIVRNFELETEIKVSISDLEIVSGSMRRYVLGLCDLLTKRMEK